MSDEEQQQQPHAHEPHINIVKGEPTAEELAALGELPAQAQAVLADPTARQLAARYRFADRVVTTGRGYAYPTARETALKLMTQVL